MKAFSTTDIFYKKVRDAYSFCKDCWKLLKFALIPAHKGRGFPASHYKMDFDNDRRLETEAVCDIQTADYNEVWPTGHRVTHEEMEQARQLSRRLRSGNTAPDGLAGHSA